MHVCTYVSVYIYIYIYIYIYGHIYKQNIIYTDVYTHLWISLCACVYKYIYIYIYIYIHTYIHAYLTVYRLHPQPCLECRQRKTIRENTRRPIGCLPSKSVHPINRNTKASADSLALDSTTTPCLSVAANKQEPCSGVWLVQKMEPCTGFRMDMPEQIPKTGARPAHAAPGKVSDDVPEQLRAALVRRVARHGQPFSARTEVPASYLKR